MVFTWLNVKLKVLQKLNYLCYLSNLKILIFFLCSLTECVTIFKLFQMVPESKGKSAGHKPPGSGSKLGRTTDHREKLSGDERVKSQNHF